jgi:hypothetical protein
MYPLTSVSPVSTKDTQDFLETMSAYSSTAFNRINKWHLEHYNDDGCYCGDDNAYDNEREKKPVVNTDLPDYM